MKRSKRSMVTRAFKRGYSSGLAGRSQVACPHEKSETRANWLAGWRTGRTDRMAGLTGVAGLEHATL
jgi:ribosome modulation factor